MECGKFYYLKCLVATVYFIGFDVISTQWVVLYIISDSECCSFYYFVFFFLGFSLWIASPEHCLWLCCHWWCCLSVSNFPEIQNGKSKNWCKDCRVSCRPTTFEVSYQGHTVVSWKMCPNFWNEGKCSLQSCMSNAWLVNILKQCKCWTSKLLCTIDFRN